MLHLLYTTYVCVYVYDVHCCSLVWWFKSRLPNIKYQGLPFHVLYIKLFSFAVAVKEVMMQMSHSYTLNKHNHYYVYLRKETRMISCAFLTATACASVWWRSSRQLASLLVLNIPPPCFQFSQSKICCCQQTNKRTSWLDHTSEINTKLKLHYLDYEAS